MRVHLRVCSRAPTQQELTHDRIRDYMEYMSPREYKQFLLFVQKALYWDFDQRPIKHAQVSKPLPKPICPLAHYRNQLRVHPH